jgi:hypothetical protein
MHKTTASLALFMVLGVKPAAAQAQAPAPTTPPATEPAATEPAVAPSPAAEPRVVEPAPAASQPAAEPPPAAAATEAPEDLKLDRVAIGDEGFFQPGALIQGWYFFSKHDKTTTNTFRIRRAELSIKGEMVPGLVGYKVMIDPAKTLKFNSGSAPVLDAAGDPVTPAESVNVTTAPDDTSILQDVSVTFITDYAEVSIGQFKIPVSYEGFNSSSKLLFPERALVSRQFGDRRDIGLRLDKKFEHFGYHAGIYNGAGLNRLDQNNQKDIALRLEAYPIKGITVGAVGYATLGERDDAATRDRVEGDFRLELANALVMVEYIRGWDGPKGSRLEGHGAYVAGGYTFFDRLQPLVRLGHLDTDVDTANTETNAYELGFNYYLRKQLVKLQASFGVFDPTASGAKSRQELTLSTQLSF